MNRIIAVLCIAMIFAAAVTADEQASQKTEEARKVYFDDLQRAQAKYRKALAEALAGADKIEVFSLDSQIEKAKETEAMFWENRLPDGFFPIVPYRAQVRILARTSLTGEDMKKVLGPLQALVAAQDDDGGALCHHPAYGIRVWSKDEILFQSSFCWECLNYYLSYPSNTDWVGMHDTALKEALDGLPLVAQKADDRVKGKGAPVARKSGKKK